MNTILKVLIIVTSYGELAGEPNGTYIPEVTHAVHALHEANIHYEFASPLGGAVPVYGADTDQLTQDMMADAAFQAKLSNTLLLQDVKASDYDAVFFPGGYGLLTDLIDNSDSHQLVKAMVEQDKPVAAVCHGPAALGKIKLADGTFLVADRNVTGFTREEEVNFGAIDKIPFLLEELMLQSGATYQKRKAWDEFVVSDGLLITGQNPASAGAVGQALVMHLQKVK